MGVMGVFKGDTRSFDNGSFDLGYSLGGPPSHPVIVTIGDNKDYIRVLLYSYSTTIIGWGILLGYNLELRGGLGLVG